MSRIKHLESNEFSLETNLSLKGERKVFVVFSTFGEREADLINRKIELIKSEAGSFVDRIFLSHRREGDAEELTEIRAKEADPEAEVIICNSLKVPDMGDERGKGADMRRTLYLINRDFLDGYKPEDIVVVFLDTDVITEFFGVHFVLGLSGAVLQGHDFAKASFWRAMGRVKKYVAQPLFSVVDHPDLNNLSNLSYPLSGEVAGTLNFFNSVNFWQIYGVETGINIDSIMKKWSVADVNLGLYDHEHHGEINIQKMSFGIIRTYLKKLEDYGIIEFKKGARISDRFLASRINEDGKRETLNFDLTEKKYRPLMELKID